MLPYENELVIQPFLEKNIVQVEKLDTSLLDGWKLHPGLRKWQDKDLSIQLQNAIRINPHQNDSDAFFIAKLRVIGT